FGHPLAQPLMIAATAFAWAPFRGSAMQVRVGPAYGGMQSSAGSLPVRAFFSHFVTHFCFQPMNLLRLLFIALSHLSLSLVLGAHIAAAEVAKNMPATAPRSTVPSLPIIVPSLRLCKTRHSTPNGARCRIE